MLNLGRAVLACIPAALAGAWLGTLSILTGIGFMFPAAAFIAILGFPVFILPFFAMGSVAALFFTCAVMVPTHLFFQRWGLNSWAWYLVAGCLAGLMAAGAFHFADSLGIHDPAKDWLVLAAVTGGFAIGPVYWRFVRPRVSPDEQSVIEPY